MTLFDQAVSARESRAKVKTDAALAERGKRGEVRQALLEMILPVLADPGIPDERVGGVWRGQIGMGVLREAAATGWRRCPVITAGSQRWTPRTRTCANSPRTSSL